MKTLRKALVPAGGFGTKLLPATNTAPSGATCFRPIYSSARGAPPGAAGEIQLTDAMRRMLGRRPFLGPEYEGRRFDAGNKPGFVKANVYVGLCHPEVRDELLSFIQTLDLGLDLA